MERNVLIVLPASPGRSRSQVVRFGPKNRAWQDEHSKKCIQLTLAFT
jgi:hypothetical protein